LTNNSNLPTPTAPPLPTNADFTSSTKAPNQKSYNSGSDHYTKSVGQEISSFANVLGAKIKEGWNNLVNDQPMPDRIPTPANGLKEPQYYQTSNLPFQPDAGAVYVPPPSSQQIKTTTTNLQQTQKRTATPITTTSGNQVPYGTQGTQRVGTPIPSLMTELNHVGAAIKRASMPYIATASTAVKKTSDKISKSIGSESIAYYDKNTGERIDPKTGKKWVNPNIYSQTEADYIAAQNASIESQAGYFNQQQPIQGKANAFPPTDAPYQQTPAYVGRTQ